jgi:hypothetical protein
MQSKQILKQMERSSQHLAASASHVLGLQVCVSTLSCFISLNVAKGCHSPPPKAKHLPWRFFHGGILTNVNPQSAQRIPKAQQTEKPHNNSSGLFCESHS